MTTKVKFFFASAALILPLATFGLSKPIAVSAEELPSTADAPRMQSMSFVQDPSQGMAFSWNTDNVTSSDLEVVEASDPQGFASSNVKRFSGTVKKSTVAKDKFIHRVEAKNLTAETKYNYRFGDIELNAFAESGSFVTSSTKQKDFRFVHLSDPQGWTQGHYEQFHKTLEEVSKLNPSFIVDSGDVVNNSWEGHTPILDQWEWALTDQWDIMKDLPHMAVAGNHDGAKDDFASRFNLPTPEGATTTTGTYYSFDYEGVHFSCLNTNDAGHDEENASGLSKEQYDWFKADLIAHKDDKFKIVVTHKGLFDTGSHCANLVSDSPDYDIPYIRAQIAPLCTKYGVSLVLQGHDHLYSETYPTIARSTPSGASYSQEEIEPVEVDYDGETIATYAKPTGTIYLNTGSASGSKYYSVVNYDQDTIFARKTENGKGRAYTLLEVKGDALISRTYTLTEEGNSELYTSFAIDTKMEQKKEDPTPEADNSSVLPIVLGATGGGLLVAAAIAFLLIKKSKKKGN